MGFISQSGLKLSEAYADIDAEIQLQRPRHPRRRPEGLPVRRGPQGRHQAVGVQGLRLRLHARAPDRHLHGVQRGRLRRVLQLRALRPRARGRLGASPRSQSVSRRCSTSSRPRARSGRSSATRRSRWRTGPAARRRRASSRACSCRRSPTSTLEAMADAGTVSVLGGQIAMTTDSFVVNPIVFPGGTIGDLAVNGTVNDVAMAGAKPVALTLSLILEEGLPADMLKDAGRRDRQGRRRAAGVPIVAGDTKVVPRGMCDEMYICTTGIGVLDDRAEPVAVVAAARRQDPRLRPDRRSRHGDHARPRRVRARRRHQVRHHVPLADGRQAAG